MPLGFFSSLVTFLRIRDVSFCFTDIISFILLSQHRHHHLMMMEFGELREEAFFFPSPLPFISDERKYISYSSLILFFNSLTPCST